MEVEQQLPLPVVAAALGGPGGCEDRVRIGKERHRKLGWGDCSSTRENIPLNCDFMAWGRGGWGTVVKRP